MNFGEYLRTKRVQQGFTLRRFCNEFGYDPAYISRLETNKLPPPEDYLKLAELALRLGISRNSTEWAIFHDFAAQYRQDVADDIKKAAPEIFKVLPAFLRTRDKRKISKENVKRLLNFLTKEKDK